MGGGGGGGSGWLERRIEVFVKIQKKIGGGGGQGGWLGVRMDLKFLGKFTKKKWGGGVRREGGQVEPMTSGLEIH